MQVAFLTKRSDVLLLLKDIIRNEELFDDQNPSVVICSPDLEQAFNMRAFYVSEL